ncbi:MAG: hypothetical protein JWQ57_357 [Mucilaginibacter sp.]|nr:hypothetical protein [Mucilaginibacter sp.]
MDAFGGFSSASLRVTTRETLKKTVMTYKIYFSDVARGRVKLQCKAHSACWGCGQEKRGLVTESPGRRQRPCYKTDHGNITNNQQLTITSL